MDQELATATRGRVQLVIYIETTDNIEVMPVGYIMLFTDAQFGPYHNTVTMTKLCFSLYSFSKINFFFQALRLQTFSLKLYVM
jgi:hypothetical protein